MQNTYQFISDKGVFSLPGAADYSDLYFPVAGECGIKSAVTPTLGGDCKLDQNTFLLEPVSVENLHNNRNARNFWCHIGTHGSWSATGNSAEEIAKKFTDLADFLIMPCILIFYVAGRDENLQEVSAFGTDHVFCSAGRSDGDHVCGDYQYRQHAGTIHADRSHTGLWQERGQSEGSPACNFPFTQD